MSLIILGRFPRERQRIKRRIDMLTFILILITCLLGSATSIIYYRSKYWNYYDISKNALNEVSDIENEWKKYVELNELSITALKNKIHRSYKQKFNNNLIKKTKELETKLSKKYNTLAKNLEQDYNNACEEVKNELFEQLNLIDATIKTHVEDTALKNILTFSCSCSKDLIPVAIDFTKENTFICPKCSSKYKIAISANPILIGRTISDAQFADLLEERLNENKGKNN